MLRPGMFGSLDEFGLRYCDGRPALDPRQATAPSRLDLRCDCPPAAALIPGNRRCFLRSSLRLLAERLCQPQLLPLLCWSRGASNLDELHGRLEQALMIRRLKKDVRAAAAKWPGWGAGNRSSCLSTRCSALLIEWDGPQRLQLQVTECHALCLRRFWTSCPTKFASASLLRWMLRTGAGDGSAVRYSNAVV